MANWNWTPLSQLVESQGAALGTELLPVVHEHALAVEGLDYHHRDPFDRILVAQALVERLTLLTADPRFDAYPVDVLPA